MTTFYICRHGQTENNLKGRLSGWIDTPLTDEGYKNVQATLKKIKDIKFDSIHSSDLGRAFMTGYLLAKGLNYKDAIILEKGLREVNYGELANKIWDDVTINDPNLLNKTDFVAPNGESLSQMQHRVMGCINQISLNNPSKTILLTCHDGTINAILASFKKVDLGGLMKDRVNPHDFLAKFTFYDGNINSFEEY